MSSDFLSDLDRWVMESFEKKAEEAATSHPSANVDDGNKPATEGARSSENEADVKADIPGDNVNTAKETDATGAGRGENTPALEMANAKPTGEDPANETASVKAKPEDPGTSHPAKATMGEKYSAAQLVSLGDEILNDIATAEAVQEKKAEAEAPVEEKKEDKKEDKAEEKKEEKSEASEAEMKEAEAAGRAAAATIIDAVQTKKASAVAVDQSAVIDSIVKNAAADAQNVVEYLAMFKQAMEGVAPEELAALAGAAEAPALGAAEAPALGAAPADAGLAGAAPAAGGDAEIEALVDALVEAGVSPEELLALAGEGEGAAPVEAAPVAEAAPAEAAPEAPAETPAEEPAEEAEKEEEPKEAAAKKAALREALKAVAKKTA